MNVRELHKIISPLFVRSKGARQKVSNAFLRGASLGESVGLNLGKDDGKLGQDDFLAAQLATLTESATDTSSAKAPRQRKRKARQLAKSKASKKQSMMSKLLFGSSAVEDVETDLADLSAITKVTA